MAKLNAVITTTTSPERYVSVEFVYHPCGYSEVIRRGGLNSEEDKASASKLFNASKNALVEFNEKFQREANEYDKDVLKRTDGLNTTIVFVSVPSPEAYPQHCP